LEDLVARVDAPSLQNLSVTYFYQPVFEIPQLSRFIGRTKRLTSPRKASIQFSMKDVVITEHFQESPCGPEIRLQLSCRDLDRRIASIAYMCRQLSPFLRTVERLDIKAFLLFSTRRPHQIDPTHWLDLFRSFQGVKTLEVTDTPAPNIASALEHATKGITQDVFPALCDLRLNRWQESLSASIVKFTGARQLSGRPISVHYRGESSPDYAGEGD
jgi:hypothetical protein